MSKVVYLLGAGASFGTREKGIGSPIITGLPIVSEIEGELENLTSILGSLSLNDKELEESKKSLIKDFHDLKTQCSNNSSIDSYAKKLCLQGDKKGFSRVELLLTIFFILEQIVHKPDMRYESFLSKVAQKDIACDFLRLNEKVGILSWNYDNQIELAYRRFFTDSYSNIRERLGIYDVKGDEQNEFLHKYCNIIKLNGTANFTREEDWMNSANYNTIDETVLKIILKKYDICVRLGRPCDGMLRLNFAWEKLWSNDMLTTMIPKLVQDAQALVVIGYTFPDYNRDIDRLIFESMPNLSKIYIQDPLAEQVKQSVQLIIPRERINIEIYPKRIGQFLLPPEL